MINPGLPGRVADVAREHVMDAPSEPIGLHGEAMQTLAWSNRKLSSQGAS